MKKLVVISAIVLGGFISKTASAQVGVSLSFNTGYHRVYAPAAPVVVEQPVYQEEVAPAYYGYRDRNWDHDRYDRYRDYNRRVYMDRDRYDYRMYRGYDRDREYARPRDFDQHNTYRNHEEHDNRMQHGNWNGQERFR